MIPVVYKRHLRYVTQNSEQCSEYAVMQVNVNSKTLKETIEILSYLSTTFCPKMSKKNNQPSVSDADQEIPTLGWSTGNVKPSFPA